MDHASQVAIAAAVNTTIGAASGTIATLFIAMAYQYFTLGVVVWDLIIAGNGALAGLVSITGPAGFVQPWAAFIIGGIGGFVYFVASKVNLHVLKVRAGIPGGARGGWSRARILAAATACCASQRDRLCWSALHAYAVLCHATCMHHLTTSTHTTFASSCAALCRLMTLWTPLLSTPAAASGACWPPPPLPPRAWSPTCMAPAQTTMR